MKYILYFYNSGTRGIVKNLKGRVFMNCNFETKGKARKAAFQWWVSQQLFAFRVLFTGKNKFGAHIKI